MQRLSLIVLFLSFYMGQISCLAETNNFKSLMMMNSGTTAPATTSTFCMGRFLIDAPIGSKLSGGNYKYDFVKIEPVRAMPLEEFEKDVAGRESKLRLLKNKKTQQSMLLQSVVPEKNTRILASWKVDVSTAQISIAGYRWINGSRYLLEDDVGGSKQGFGMNRMQEVLSRLRPRGDTDIPDEPGYCFAGGFVTNAEWENEEASLDIDIAGHPDAFLSVWIYPLASHKHDKPLLERMGGMTQLLGNLATSVHVLRKGDRQLGPYKGQEHLASAPNSGGMRAHAFVWETQGDGTLETPAIKIELSTGHSDRKGNPQKTSLTDAQAMKLWDDILNSFRLRPTGDAVKTSDIASEPSPRLPLGELVATGRTCPQTGWWQTSEAGEIEGGARRYFRAGDAMPQVTTLGESSLWQKLKGARPAYRTATVWKLVDYDTEVPHTQSIAQAGSPDPQGRDDESSHAYYGADPKQLAWNEVRWKSDKLIDGDFKAALLIGDDLNGTVQLSFKEANKCSLEIQKAQGPGDGTVPAESGSAPTPHVVQIFRHEGKEKGHESYDHQDSYKAKLAQAVTLYSIVKIVADSDWVKQYLNNA